MNARRVLNAKAWNKLYARTQTLKEMHSKLDRFIAYAQYLRFQMGRCFLGTLQCEIK